MSAPKARPKKVFTPDTSLSAPERLGLVIKGGISEKKGNLLEGNPKDVALKAVQFLRKEKLIP